MNAAQNQKLSIHIASALRDAVPRILAAYLYGSTARGDNHATSDIDIGVLLPPGQRLPNKLALAADLRQRTGRDVDIVDLRLAGNFLRMEVLRDGLQIVNADPERVLAWEGHAMSEYTQHRAAIHDILQDFRQTGIGYHR